MCGGCGGQRTSDWASPALSTPRSRSAAAYAAHQLCQQAGIPVAVSAAPSGFIARWPTGRSAVTDTLTGLWAAIAGHHRLPDLEPPLQGPGAPVRRIRTPATTVTLAVRPGHRTWDGTLTADMATIVCADEPELDRALRQLTTDPLRHRVRVTTITGINWPDLPTPQGTAPDQLPALLSWATALQIGGHTHHHRLTVHCGTTSFAVIHGHGLGLSTTESRW